MMLLPFPGDLPIPANVQEHQPEVEFKEVFRLVATTVVYLLPQPLATCNQHPGSLSNSDSDRDCTSMLKVVHRHAALLGARGVREQEAIVYRRWAGLYLARGNPRSAIVPAARRLAI